MYNKVGSFSAQPSCSCLTQANTTGNDPTIWVFSRGLGDGSLKIIMAPFRLCVPLAVQANVFSSCHQLSIKTARLYCIQHDYRYISYFMTTGGSTGLGLGDTSPPPHPTPNHTILFRQWLHEIVTLLTWPPLPFYYRSKNLHEMCTQMSPKCTIYNTQIKDQCKINPNQSKINWQTAQLSIQHPSQLLQAKKRRILRQEPTVNACTVVPLF